MAHFGLGWEHNFVLSHAQIVSPDGRVSRSTITSEMIASVFPSAEDLDREAAIPPKAAAAIPALPDAEAVPAAVPNPAVRPEDIKASPV